MSFINIIIEVYYKTKSKNIKPKIINLKNNCPKSLKKSLKLRFIDAGSDEGILAEISSLEGPYYSLESYNISFTASPKHSDGLFIVGGISKNMKQAVKNAYEVISEPKIIIACGDKAINGDNTFESKLLSVKDVLGEVNLEIPGTPNSKDIFNYLVNFVK